MRAAEVDDFFPKGLNASNTLDGYRIARVIMHLSLDDAPSSAFVDLKRICEIGKVRKSGGSDRNFLAVSESILKMRLRYFVFRIICGLDPLVIDLRRDSRANNTVSGRS